MTKEEATEFIDDEVGRSLWKRVAIVASVFGIANVVALFALWNSVSDSARTTAKDKAEEIAKKSVDQALEKFTEATRLAENRIADLDARYADLYIKVGEANLGLKQLQTIREQQESKLAEIQKNINVLSASDQNRYGEFIKRMNELPNVDTKPLIDSLKEAFPAVTKLQGIMDQFKNDLTAKAAQKDFEQLREIVENGSFTTITPAEIEISLRESGSYRLQGVPDAAKQILLRVYLWTGINEPSNDRTVTLSGSMRGGKKFSLPFKLHTYKQAAISYYSTYVWLPMPLDHMISTGVDIPITNNSYGSLLVAGWR